MTKTASKTRTPVTDRPDEMAAEEPRPSVNMITRKSRAVQPLLTGLAVPRFDVTIPRSQRTMGGLDIEEWRGALKLSKFEAEAALGFRSTTLYNRACSLPVLPITTEILLRLYDEKPEPCPWSRLSFRELFDLMYEKDLALFSGKDLERAKIDLEARFTVMFGRSTTRAYSWLRKGRDSSNLPQQASSYADVERILSKLTQWPDPAATFERVALRCLALRGVDLDELFPIPSVERPPERGRPGRKPPADGLAGRRRRGRAAAAVEGEDVAPVKAARKIRALTKAKPAAPAKKVGKTPAAAKKPAKAAARRRAK